MASHAEQNTDLTTKVDFDQPAQKGWKFFTSFLLWNITSCVVILLLIGIFTVWS